MQWLREFYERLKNTWGNMPKNRKIGLVSIVAVLVISLLVYYFIFGRTTFTSLYSNLTIDESGKIVQNLDEKGLKEGKDYKLENDGTNVLVDQNQIDRLRIDLAIDGVLPTNGTGYEIFDNTSFAMTDEDRQIMYQRAVQGELQRSIMSLEEVEFARVLLSMPQKTVFSKETQKGSASIVLKLKPFKTLTKEQVKGIVSMVSGAVKDIPEENVSIVDTNANLLSQGIGTENDFDSVNVASDRLKLKKNFEDELATNLQTMLEKAMGTGKVLVKVYADLNFDAQESTVVTYNNNPKIRNYTEKIQKASGANQGSGGASPLDNNISYPVTSTSPGVSSNGVDTFETTVNNELDQSTVHTVNAPGAVKKLSTSVIVDGDLSPTEKDAITGIVAASIGFNAQRGDLINVSSITFDKTESNKLMEQLAQEEKQYKRDMLIKNILKYGGIAAGVLTIFIVILLIRRRTHANEELEYDESGAMAMIHKKGEQQPMPVEEMIEDATIKLNPNKQDPTEKEIKEFATDAPDKVAEIVKTWILKDEG